MKDVAVLTAVQFGVVAVLTAIQLGLIIMVFALLDYTRFFDINLSMFLDLFLAPLFVAMFVVSGFWHGAMRLVGRV